MYTLILGSTLAVLSAWATVPTDTTFNTGLARHFAEAMHQAQPDCLASTVLVDSGEMLVMLDERGDVMEIDLGGLPVGASSAMMLGTSGYAELIPASMGAMEESNEEVGVTVEVVNGVGTIKVTRNGEEDEFEIDLGDMGDDADGPSLGNLFEKLMSGQGGPEAQAAMVIEVEDEEGQRRVQIDGEDIDLNQIMMMVMGEDGEEGVWAMDSRGGGYPDRHEMRRDHRGMGDGGEMMRQHMHFLREMHEDPHRVWDMIERLPPEMREEHEMFFESMMRGDDNEDRLDHEFIEQSEGFVEKLSMASKVVEWLSDSEAVAIFAVWQAREHMGPADRVALLEPMIKNETLHRSVRNASAWVVMDAKAEIGDSAGGVATLREIILRNGAMK
ncbi:MAG: hypothetical protein P8I91_05445 [Phycisphaerales bacterium]|nr:hypothetical protein [Phycisphaerales bacterium]